VSFLDLFLALLFGGCVALVSLLVYWLLGKL
jgi:hypothetical protein